MEIHNPKPARNLREFLSEITIVVVGIVIALSAEQAVQSLEGRQRLKLADEQMHQEIAGDDGPQVFQRVALSACVTDALDAIRNSVEQSAPRATVLQAIEQLWTPRHTWDSVAFQSATASGVLASVPPDRLGVLSYFYSFMPVLERANEREFHDGADLQAISRTGGGLTDFERARVLEGVEALRRDNAEIVRLTTLAKDAMKLLGIEPADWARTPGRASSLSEPARVISELEHVPMAQRCVVPLKQSLGLMP